MPEVPAPKVHVNRYTVSCLPPTNPLAVHFKLAVSERMPDKWAVTNITGECLSADGQWDPELNASQRPDGWDLTHRFDLATALRLAKAEAPMVIVNGVTVAEALARAEAAKVAR